MTPDLLARLWAEMWERGEEEIARLGLTKAEAFVRFLAFARSGYARVISADGVPVAVVGLATDGREAFTFMQASKAFDEHYREIIRRIRRFLRAHPGSLSIYSVVVHPQTEGFFRVLGFERDGNWRGTTAAGYPLYRFNRKE